MRRLFLWMISAFLSVLIHELGHALTMRQFGDPQPGILLYAMGGLARGSRLLTRMQDVLVSAAGPFLQIAAAVFLWLVDRAYPVQSQVLGYAIAAFIYISLFWGIFNLLPIVPMDGGRIALAIMGPRRLNVALGISMVLAVGLGAFAVYHGAIFAALFLGLMAYNNWKQIRGEHQIRWDQTS